MTIGFIGGGNMAEAIIASLSRTEAVSAELLVSDISPERRAHLESRYGVRTTADSSVVAAQAETLILAVKPQVMAAVTASLKAHVEARHLVISIAAGIRLETLEVYLPTARLVRVMPNLPCQVGMGVSAFCPGEAATEADLRLVAAILNSFGIALQLPECAFDAVTALSGSGPAFIACLAAHLIQAGTEEGLAPADASQLVLHTLRGTAELLIARNLDPAALIRQVKSPGGTTAAGLAVLEASPIETILRDTIGAAAKRSKELSTA